MRLKDNSKTSKSDTDAKPPINQWSLQKLLVYSW